MPPRPTQLRRKATQAASALHRFLNNLPKRFLRLHLGTQACLLLLALLLFNAALSPLSERKWDWTAEKLATLSPDAEKFLGKLSNNYHLTLYASSKIVRDIPAYADYERRAVALLEEMTRHSKNKNKSNNKRQRRLAFTLTRPEPFDISEDEALESGLSPLAIDQSGEQVFFGLKITREKSQTRPEANLLIPFLLLEREQMLEYEVMRTLVELEQVAKPRIALVTSLEPLGGYSAGGYGAATRGSSRAGMWRAFQALEADFDIDTLFVSEDFDAQKTDLVIFLHPRIQDIELLYALDQYMLQGGKALLFLDPHYESTSPSRRSSLNTPIPFASNDFPLLERWGLEISSDIVADARYAMLVNTGSAQQVEPVPHLAWLQLPEEALADREPTRTISSLILASAGAIEEHAGEKANSSSEEKQVKPIPKRISIAPLVRSSEESDLLSRDFFAQTPPELLQAYEAFSTQKKQNAKRNALGVVVKGRYKSLFEETPQGMEFDATHLKASTQDFQAVVVADADFLNDRFWVERQDFLGETLYTPFSGNGAFLLDAVEWLVGIEGLSGLRSRGVGNRPLVYLERLRLRAEGRWRLEQQALDQKLQEIEQRLAELRQLPKTEGSVEEQAQSQTQSAEQNFVRQLIETRGALRNIQRALNREVGAMQTFVQVFHATAVPLAIVVFFLLRAWRRNKKTAQKLAQKSA